MDDLREILNEEMGIANKVVELSQSFYLQTIKALKQEKNANKTNEIFTKKNVSLTFYIDKMKVSTSVVYRNFLSKDYVKIYDMPYLTDGGSLYVNEKLSFMFINIYGICGTIVKDKAMETIQHEIEHLYQEYLTKNQLSSNTIYVKAKDDMNSDDINRKKIGTLVYLSFKSEQEAFCNGLYAYIMDKNQPYTDDLLKESETWGLYMEMKSIFDELQTNNELKNIFNEYFSQYGLTIANVENSKNNFVHRIGRTIIKIQKDKAKQGWKN